MKYFYLVIILTLISCTTNKTFVGTYLESTYGDTLIIRNNKSYYYNEKLNTGFWGSTEGKWTRKRNEIFFYANRKALTGCSIKLQKTPCEGQLKISLGLANSNTPVEIISIHVIKNEKNSTGVTTKFAQNSVQITNESFDSIIIATDEFVPLKFSSRTLQHGNSYHISIHPAERLYELDKTPMIRNALLLVTKPSERFSYIRNQFHKIDVKDYL